MLFEYCSNNPLASHPIADSRFYWTLAEQYADGRLIGDTPFLSAPLYPYILGAIRALGGGLRSVYGMQIVFNIATAVLIAWIGLKRFNASIGLLGATVFLLMVEPATASFRILTSSVQLLAVTIAWAAAVRALDRQSFAAWAATGVAFGIACHTNGSLVFLAPPVIIWVAMSANRRRIASAGVACAAWLAAIAPAAAYNAYVCGEFLPLSAHGGLTLRHGNNENANGTYTAAPGVSTDKNRQHIDTFRAYEAATGKTPTWRAVDAYYRDQVVAYWREDPLRAIELAARKAYWFLSARHYGDIFVPTIERDSGLDRAWSLAPIPTAFLIPFAILGLISVKPIRRRNGLEWAMLIVPFIVVCVFWYSPRYRLPAAPVIALASAALIYSARHREGRKYKILLAAALAVAVGIQVTNRVIGFDKPEGVAPAFHTKLGQIYADQGQWKSAEKQFETALRGAPENAHALAGLGASLVEKGQFEQALRLLHQAVELQPRNADHQTALGAAYARMGKFRLARTSLQDALSLDRNHKAAHYNLAGTMLMLKRPASAVEHYRRVLEIDPAAFNAAYHLANTLAAMGRRAEATAVLRDAVEQAHRLNQPQAQQNLQAKLNELETGR